MLVQCIANNFLIQSGIIDVNYCHAKRQNKIGEKTSLSNFLPVEQQDGNSV